MPILGASDPRRHPRWLHGRPLGATIPSAGENEPASSSPWTFFAIWKHWKSEKQVSGGAVRAIFRMGRHLRLVARWVCRSAGCPPSSRFDQTSLLLVPTLTAGAVPGGGHNRDDHAKYLARNWLALGVVARCGGKGRSPILYMQLVF
jgi:hypothetical protein